MLNDPFRGYDQWKTASPYDDDRYECFIDKCCNECIFLKSCPLAVGDITELNCLVIRGIIDKQNQEMFEAEQAREAQEMDEEYDYDPEAYWEGMRDAHD